MSGFNAKVGEFHSQYKEFRSQPEKSALKNISPHEYAKFFEISGGPHQLEGLLQTNTNFDPEYVNIRRSVHVAGEITIEPVTNVNGRWIVAVTPHELEAYRIKITGGNFIASESRYQYQCERIIEASPGAQISGLHRDLDSALRIKFSLAERMLNGEPVRDLVRMYASEQTFYRGGFGKIISDDPVKEPYLRDQFLDEMENVIQSNGSGGIKKIGNPASVGEKVEFELRPSHFLGEKITGGKIRLQKVGGHCIAVFSDTHSSTGVVNQFEIHGGRAKLLFEAAHKKGSDPFSR